MFSAYWRSRIMLYYIFRTFFSILRRGICFTALYLMLSVKYMYVGYLPGRLSPHTEHTHACTNHRMDSRGQTGQTHQTLSNNNTELTRRKRLCATSMFGPVPNPWLAALTTTRGAIQREAPEPHSFPNASPTREASADQPRTSPYKATR